MLAIYLTISSGKRQEDTGRPRQYFQRQQKGEEGSFILGIADQMQKCHQAREDRRKTELLVVLVVLTKWL